ncbi:MAG: hypothetical protein WKG07_19185 [Hymenobacter sp.]
MARVGAAGRHARLGPRAAAVAERTAAPWTTTTRSGLAVGDGWWRSRKHTSLPILTFFRSPQPGRFLGHGRRADSGRGQPAAPAPSTAASPRQVRAHVQGRLPGLNRVYRFFDDEAGTKPGRRCPTTTPARSPAGPTSSAPATVAACALPCAPTVPPPGPITASYAPATALPSTSWRS